MNRESDIHGNPDRCNISLRTEVLHNYSLARILDVTVNKMSHGKIAGDEVKLMGKKNMFYVCWVKGATAVYSTFIPLGCKVTDTQ